MATITLSRGYTATIDDADLPRVSQWKWSVCGRAPYFYPVRGTGPRGKRTRVSLAEQVLGVKVRGSVRIIHVDNDPMNCQRANLKIANRKSVQRAMCKSSKATHSQYKGVSRYRDQWRAYISPGQSKYLHLGYHGTELDAALAYDEAARRIYGSDAALNFPRPGERAAHR